MWIITIVLFALAIFYLLRLSFASKPAGSDATLHLMMIRLIRADKHRYLRKIDPWMFGNFGGYPVLYHQLLSFLSEQGVRRFAKISNFLFNMLSVAICGGFAWWMTTFYSGPISNVWMLVAVAILLYLFSPLLFDLSNARNHGLSARSLGLILGQVFTCLLMAYLLTDEWLWAGAAAFTVTITLLTSQFTFQYQLFSCLILSLLLLDYRPALVLGGGLFIYSLLFFKIARSFFAFQIEHKKNFIMFNPFLRQDYGLWSYFFKRFWQDLSWTPKKGWPKFLLLHGNVWLKVLTGASVVLIAVALLAMSLVKQVQLDPVLHYLWMINLATFLITFATSFKRTRFLGEPERYLDFCLLTTAVSVALVFHDQPLWLAAFVALPLVKSAMILWEMRKPTAEIKGEEHIEAIHEYLLNEIDDVQGIRLGANNMEDAKKLSDLKYKVFYGWMFDLYKYDPYKFFKAQWPLLEREYFFRFIDDYNWNLALIHPDTFDGPLEQEGKSFVLLKKFGDLELYRIDRNEQIATNE